MSPEFGPGHALDSIFFVNTHEDEYGIPYPNAGDCIYYATYGCEYLTVDFGGDEDGLSYGTVIFYGTSGMPSSMLQLTCDKCSIVARFQLQLGQRWPRDVPTQALMRGIIA